MDQETYLAEMRDLARRVRKEANSPDMVIVVIQVTGGPHLGLGEIDEAQRRFVVEDTNALLITAVGRPLKDQWHLNRDGYRELAHELTQALLEVVYKTEENAWPGPVLDAAMLSSDKRRLVAHFAEVKQLKNAKPADFIISDPRGLTIRQVCQKITTERTRLKLTFKDPIELPAKLIYGYKGYPLATLTDEEGNRAPAVHIHLSAGEEPKDEERQAPNGAGR